ncbi:MAG: hypothetical protein AB1772_00950 [Candidatus Zixiibacteriota bacterium]
MRLPWGTACLIMVLMCASARTQQLSESVLTSDDELWEALQEGVITYDQYLVLREIIENGLDSTNRHLLDEIPNLFYLFKTDSMRIDPIEQEQVSGFRSVEIKKAQSPRIRGQVGHRYTMFLDNEQRTWYRSRADLSVENRWRFRLQAIRERGGAERVVSRSVGYRNRTGLVRRIEVGSFTTRFGLGTLFGHRGQILDASSNINAESWSYPSYGGYNGLLAELRSGGWEIRSLASLTRDSSHRMFTAGLMIERAVGKIRPGLVVGQVNLVNRGSGVSVEIPMASALVYYDYRTGYAAGELSHQGSETSATSVVLEGRHRFETAELRYAAWRYDDDFVDLTAGSKSAVLSEPDTLAAVAFSYRSRRVGQRGGLVKTTIEPSGRMAFSNSLLRAENTRDASRQQFFSGLAYNLSPDWQWRLAYLGDWRHDPGTAPADRSDHQLRLETRYTTARVRAKCYIGVDVDGRDSDHAVLFVSARYVMTDGSAYEIWSNLGEIDTDGLQYWYAFARGSWPLGSYLTAAAKLSNSYRRDGPDSNATQMSLELNATL